MFQGVDATKRIHEYSYLAYGGGGVSVGETILIVVGIICPEDNGGVLPLLNLINWLGFSLIASS